MSVTCKITQVALLKQALSTLALGKDPWATFIFTNNKQGVVVHCSSPDQGMTGSVVLPQDMFSDYHAEENACFVTQVSHLIDALSMSGGLAPSAPAGAPSSSASKVLLSYPNAQGRLVVEVHDGNRVAEVQMLTKTTKDRLLDLRFGDTLCPNTVMLRGDVGREIVTDLQAFSSDKVCLQFTPSSLQFHGLNSPQGSMQVEVGRATDAVMGFDVREPSMQSRYLISHVLQAFACSSGGSGGGSSRGFTGGQYSGGQAGAPGGSAIGASQLGAMVGGGTYGATFGGHGLDRLTIKVNAERQLQVTHSGRGDGDVIVEVKMTVVPLSLLLEEE